jgi:hypothetical protein
MQDPCRVSHVIKLCDSLGVFAVKVMQFRNPCPSLARAFFKALGAERIVPQLSAVKEKLIKDARGKT